MASTSRRQPNGRNGRPHSPLNGQTAVETTEGTKDENQHEMTDAGIRHRERIREAGQTHRQPRPDNRQDKMPTVALDRAQRKLVGSAVEQRISQNDLVRKWTSAQPR